MNKYEQAIEHIYVLCRAWNERGAPWLDASAVLADIEDVLRELGKEPDPELEACDETEAG